MLISLGANRAEAWEAALFKGLGDRASEYERVCTLLAHNTNSCADQLARSFAICRSLDYHTRAEDSMAGDQPCGDEREGDRTAWLWGELPCLCA